MDKIKRFFECLIPVPICNIRCDYCYITQRNGWDAKPTPFKYSPEQIGRALTQKRLGGISYFSLCGSGETLVPKETMEITRRLLENGHYVNITTNGILSRRFDRILALEPDLLERLHFSFSFHYLELLKRKKVDAFFENVNRVREQGCSFLVQVNLYDEYIAHLGEIKRLCIERVGALPHIVATRRENDLFKEVELYSELPLEKYVEVAKEFDSPLFDFTMKNFGVKRREFCYAGDWTGTLNMATGIMQRCYASNIMKDVFEDPDSPIPFVAVGSHCRSLFCMNSSHFMTLGVIPDQTTPTYARLRNRAEANWYSPTMTEFLSGKLGDNHERYGALQVAKSHLYAVADAALGIKPKLGRLYRKIKKKPAAKLIPIKVAAP